MKRILLAEDDPSFRKIVQHILKHNGYLPVPCSSGEAALKLLDSNDFWAVITDFKMGRISGLRVAKTALEKSPPVPVFIITAYAEGLLRAHSEGYWGQAWANVKNRVFSKPLDGWALITALNALNGY